MRRTLVLALVGVLALGLGGAWWWRSRATAEDPGQIGLGAGVYAAHCAACHGAALEGQPDWQRPRADGTLPAPPHDMTGHTWHHPDQLLRRITRDGGAAVAPPGFKSGMPAFRGLLSEAEIAAVLAYIKSQWPPAIRARQEDLNRGG